MIRGKSCGMSRVVLFKIIWTIMYIEQICENRSVVIASGLFSSLLSDVYQETDLNFATVEFVTLEVSPTSAERVHLLPDCA